METSSLSPSSRTSSIRKLVFLLSQKFSPLRIYEFSYRSVWNEHLHPNNQFTHCLLMIMEKTERIDYTVQDFINGRYKNGTVTVICHDREAIGTAIASNSRFFITALTLGKLLYSNREMLGYEPIQPYDWLNSVQRAQELFTYRMPIAHGFFAAAMECLRLGHYTIGTFLLHQCAEQALIGMVRVHLGYRSEFHNIERLLGLCLAFSFRPYHILVDTENNGRLFNILAKSYSSARYNSGFSVSEADADAIVGRVSKLLSLAAEMYLEQIKVLESNAERHSAELNFNIDQITYL